MKEHGSSRVDSYTCKSTYRCVKFLIRARVDLAVCLDIGRNAVERREKGTSELSSRLEHEIVDHRSHRQICGFHIV